MKLLNLEFKFTDHTSRSVAIYCCAVSYDNKVDEWHLKQDATEKHIEWVGKHIVRVHRIKEYFKNHISTKFFAGNAFNNFHFIKESCFKMCTNVNMTPDAPLEESLIRRINHVENINYKFSGGTKPANCMDIYNYTEKRHCFVFSVREDSNGNITHEEHPPKVLESIQTGGYKHLKYKKKYLAEKQKSRN